MVEFALVAPVILLILTGICSLGIVMNQYQVLTLCTSDAARAFALSRGQASYSPTTASDPCEYAYQIGFGNGIAAGQTGSYPGAASGLTASNVTVTIIFTPPTGSASTYSNVTATSGCSSLVLGVPQINGTVTVQASYPVSPLVGWATKSLNLTASSSEQIQ